MGFCYNVKSGKIERPFEKGYSCSLPAGVTAEEVWETIEPLLVRKYKIKPKN